MNKTNKVAGGGLKKGRIPPTPPRQNPEKRGVIPPSPPANKPVVPTPTKKK